MADQNKPRRDLKGFWLLPILALGVGTLLVTRKKLAPPRQPTKAEISEMAKYEAFRNAKYLVLNQILQEHPGSVIVFGFAPYTDASVKDLGRNRFRCSSSVTARSRSGVPLHERWQCIVAGSQTSWTCESFQQTGWQRDLPSQGGRNTVAAGDGQAGK